ncbi:di-heme oxidoredictase family protein [Pelagibius sp. Alg239-R121]|uniref:di-heme oxidoredictase family protein n=1 Tax=Pelagibius sp. Alg239-R121 TaxID=2993448 RepID=UPI0024A707E2|nr:di-heme oxidoredictase family protein [Pelagibius sp. Alg239-R121]
MSGIAHGEEDLKPVEQSGLNAVLAEKGAKAAFNHAFEAGDELTEFNFTAERGVGANVGEGRRFTRIPRADLTGATEWSAHLPTREGGPNATACIACHNVPMANGAGDVAVNVLVDPAHTGDPKRFLERNTLPLLALGVPQRLAEEMTAELKTQRDAMVAQACRTGAADTALVAKAVAFGTLAASRVAIEPCKVEIDKNGLEGIDEDLVVKPFGWKGNHATIRSFTRGAAHNELGLQAVELVGDKDGDHDGIINELTVGDITSLTLYMAGLERPVTRLELADLGLTKVSEMEKFRILEGEALFASTGCAACHVPEMKLDTPIFSEPSATPGFYDVTFPSGTKPSDESLTQKTAIRFDLTADQPNNRIETATGEIKLLGALRETKNGGALAHWFTDFKRHNMGPVLADPDAPLGIAAEMWPTRSLAGVGSTGPWLHDGRATTLDEAIRTHGGEASDSRGAYASLPKEEREALIAYLENLVIFKQEEEDEDL